MVIRRTNLVFALVKLMKAGLVADSDLGLIVEVTIKTVVLWLQICFGV